ELMELAITALLRTLIAKHRPRVPQPRRLIVQQTLLDAGAHGTGRSLGTQAERLPAAVGEGVHFLFDDVGDFADRASKELGALSQRQAYLPIPVGLKDLGRDTLQRLPRAGVRGQN